jgi:uracil-DNA glycosylase
MAERYSTLEVLLAAVRACRACEQHLPLGPRPVLRAGATARILIVGQAPGARVHATGVPWDDLSGERLRAWMGMNGEAFYDESRVAIIPMGYCYPGRGNGGDLPPRRECAALWLDLLLAKLPRIELTLLIGQYAQRHFLGSRCPIRRHATRRGSNVIRGLNGCSYLPCARGLKRCPRPDPRLAGPAVKQDSHSVVLSHE